MKLKGLPFPVFGDVTFRGPCPSEEAEQVAAVARLRQDDLGALVIHVKNEGRRTMRQAQRDKANGLASGAPDLWVPGAPTFLCEVKRRDHTKSRWQDGQVAYLTQAQAAGAFSCLCLGAEAVLEAFEVWRVLVVTGRG
ncbi:MAG: hypothetical protein MJH10_10185 [Epibacterium sp.]|nr:hypothetical protein [Epibacterium sp.]NQX73906.1 hypothetical protein [Epibacterium sp.]